jgi:hypothetical protein
MCSGQPATLGKVDRQSGGCGPNGATKERSMFMRRIQAGTASLLARLVTSRPPEPRPAVLDRWVDHAMWDWSYRPGGGGITNMLYIRVHREVIRQYIKNYYREHRQLPRNTHRVRMTYAPDGTAEYLFITRWPGGVVNMRGVVDIEVTWPPGPLPQPPEPEPLESHIEVSCGHFSAFCRFCHPDENLVFLESTAVRGMWSDAGTAPATGYLFTRRPIADWFGATREEQVALTKSIDLLRDSLEERLRRHGQDDPVGYTVRFSTGRLRTHEHLHLEVTPEYQPRRITHVRAAIRRAS